LPEAVSGASVSTVAQLNLAPYSGVTSNPFLPIQPNPAQVAAVLWGKSG